MMNSDPSEEQDPSGNDRNRGVKNEMLSPPPSDSGDQAGLSPSPGFSGASVASLLGGTTSSNGPYFPGSPFPVSNFTLSSSNRGVNSSAPSFAPPSASLRPPPSPSPLLLYPPPLPPPTSTTLTNIVGPSAVTPSPSSAPGYGATATGGPIPSAPNPYYDLGDSLVADYYGQSGEDEATQGIKAVVEEQGYISLHLRYDAHVDIAPNQAIRIVNHRKGITLALSGCATQMALVHPQGRVLQYNSRIEVQTENYPSIKNAKMWPRGVSFTSNNRALVYLVDQAGARSTTDTFHDLYADNIADTVFVKSCQMSSDSYSTTIEKSIRDLEQAEYWRTESDLDCWLINNVSIKQTPDGLVSVERKHGMELFTLKTSPSNGKARLQSSFLYLTASMGEESHIFVKSNDRRIHYNGQAFVVRNAGHSAGFDETGLLRIW